MRSLFGSKSPAGPAPTMQMWSLGLGALVTEGLWRSAVIFCEGFAVRFLAFLVCEDFVFEFEGLCTCAGIIDLFANRTLLVLPRPPDGRDMF